MSHRCVITSPLDDGPEAPRDNRSGGDSMSNYDLFMALIAVASLVFTIYYGRKR